MKARGMVVVAVLVLTACSRSGMLYGDISVPKPPGAANPAARINVMVISSTEAFEHDWAEAVAAFQQELERARAAQKAAAISLDEARLAWDKALAVPPTGRSGAARRARVRRASIRERELWKQVVAAERLLFTARKRAWEVARTHDMRAVKLLGKHAAQSEQTDENGHYLVLRVAVGKAYLYARVPIRDQSLIWFHPLQVRGGGQRADLTEANAGGWPFVP